MPFRLLAWVVLLLALLVEDATQVCWGQAGDPVSSLCTPCGIDLWIYLSCSTKWPVYKYKSGSEIATVAGRGLPNSFWTWKFTYTSTVDCMTCDWNWSQLSMSLLPTERICQLLNTFSVSLSNPLQGVYTCRQPQFTHFIPGTASTFLAQRRFKCTAWLRAVWTYQIQAFLPPPPPPPPEGPLWQPSMQALSSLYYQIALQCC